MKKIKTGKTSRKIVDIPNLLINKSFAANKVDEIGLDRSITYANPAFFILVDKNIGNIVIKKMTIESKVAFLVDENHAEKAKDRIEKPKTRKVPIININVKTVGNNCVPYVKA